MHGVGGTIYTMEKLMISGGRPLRGTVQISGAKNSAVALLPAAILADSEVVLDNLPEISDVFTYTEIITELGGKVERSGSSLRIDPSEMVSLPMHNGLVKKLRASYYLMGALLGRFGEATVCREAAALNRVQLINTLKGSKR